MTEHRDSSDIEETGLAGRYLDLLQATLTCSLWDGRDGQVWHPRGKVQRLLDRALRYRGMEIIRPSGHRHRDTGTDWPRLAHTMTGDRRLANLRRSVETVLRDEVPGDLVETGVWRGGSCILMRGILAAYGVTDRMVWVADSFAGLPLPDPDRYVADTGDLHHEKAELVVSEAEVRENFRRYGLLDDQVKFLPGWFRDTLPTAPINRLAVLRLDGDMYESTIEALEALYPRLSEGGFCIIDDYGAIEGCRAAVEAYRRKHDIHDPINKIDWTGIFWRRNADGGRR